MYAMVATHLDIAYVVGVISCYMPNPHKAHCKAITCVFRYLKGTQRKCLCYGKGALSLQGYYDADMVGDLDTHKSTSKYIFTVVGGSMSWCFKLQKFVAPSTSEVEYIFNYKSIKESYMALLA